VGLQAIRPLGAEALKSVLDERDRGGPFASLRDFRQRVSLGPHDLAALVRAGALDCFGQGREALLREVNAPRPAPRRGGVTESWPLEGLLEHPLAPRWKGEWEVLGFHAGPPLAWLLRHSLPPGLTDSRMLPELKGEEVRLAGLVLSCREGQSDTGAGPTRYFTLEDEFGPAEVFAPPGACTADPEEVGPALVVEGRVEERLGAPLVVASKVERPVPATARQRERGVQLRVVS
jgi:DNA polymerase III alpha subunit